MENDSTPVDGAEGVTISGEALQFTRASVVSAYCLHVAVIRPPSPPSFRAARSSAAHSVGSGCVAAQVFVQNNLLTCVCLPPPSHAHASGRWP